MRGGGAATTPQLRVLPGRRGDQPTTCAETVPVIGHAGLAAHRVGKAPNRASLRRARRVGVGALELDVVTSRDGDLVLYHDLTLSSGVPVSTLSLDRLRDLAPGVLTLDEAAAELGNDIPLVLDLKSVDSAEPLCEWLTGDGRGYEVAVCTDRPALLSKIGTSVPGTELWRTFPDVGVRAREHIWRVTTSLLSHRGSGAVSVGADLWSTACRITLGPREILDHLSGIPWRHTLPRLLPAVHARLPMQGVTVHHPLITRELCVAAHALGLWVVAWTVNDPAVARRVVADGVDMITTDRVEEIRDALT